MTVHNICYKGDIIDMLFCYLLMRKNKTDSPKAVVYCFSRSSDD